MRLRIIRMDRLQDANRTAGLANFAVAALFTLTIFVSATLLFALQPLFARMLLPLLGGAPAVWNTTQVFYQVTLLLGYLYAHLTHSRFAPRVQIGLHAVLLLLPLLVLPLAIPVGWQPPGASNPIPWLLLLLAVAVGLPFFVVSSSSPLLQSWFARTSHPAAHDPYFLYAASNIGSMLALLAYPFVIEPRMRLLDQSRFWSFGYGLLLVLIMLCGMMVWRAARGQQSEGNGQVAGALSLAQRFSAGASEPITWPRRFRWLGLAAVPSSLLLSVTSYLSTNIAPFPLLWVVPLALYLLTFTLVFATRPLVPHWLLQRALPIVLTPLLVCLAVGLTEPMAILFPLNLLVFFVGAMVCHGELAADRPEATRLTEFYLWMSLGGAVGGTLTALVAPLVFSSVLEYPIALVLLVLLLWHPQAEPRRSWLLVLAVPAVSVALYGLSVLFGQREGTGFLLLTFGLPALLAFSFSRRPLHYGLAMAALLLVGYVINTNTNNVVVAERSFFGINRVFAQPGSMTLVHGTIVHGKQSTDPATRLIPLTYYYPNGPLGQLFGTWSKPGRQQRVAIVGLGVGAAACYAKPDQQWTFYEIDPAVERIARDPRYFSFLRDCAPNAPVVLGDARLKLAAAPTAAYDLIVLDAYSSDAIPIHLMTREALAVYQAKLALGGILMFHISNRYLDLQPVLARLAADAGMTGLRQYNQATAEEAALGKQSSLWVAIARSPTDLAIISGDPRWKPIGTGEGTPLWTDDFHSILDVFHW